jgi:hypothetical protein
MLLKRPALTSLRRMGPAKALDFANRGVQGESSVSGRSPPGAQREASKRDAGVQQSHNRLKVSRTEAGAARLIDLAIASKPTTSGVVRQLPGEVQWRAVASGIVEFIQGRRYPRGHLGWSALYDHGITKRTQSAHGDRQGVEGESPSQ